LDRDKQRGGFVLGFVIGLLISLSLAVVFALRVIPLPITLFGGAHAVDRTFFGVQSPVLVSPSNVATVDTKMRTKTTHIPTTTQTDGARTDVATSNTHFDQTVFVQAGAFKSAEEAERRRAELAILGVEAKTSPDPQDNELLLVLIGPFSDTKAAHATIDMLDGAGISAITKPQ
jgi:cell division septation protein DedD